MSPPCNQSTPLDITCSVADFCNETGYGTVACNISEACELAIYSKIYCHVDGESCLRSIFNSINCTYGQGASAISTRILDAFRFVLSILGLVFNCANVGVVCIGGSDLCRNSYLKMMVSLAVSDIMIDISMCSRLLGSYDDFHTTMAALHFTGSLSCLSNLTLIAVDHYVRVLKPVRHVLLFSQKNVAVQLLTLWASSVVMGCLRMVDDELLIVMLTWLLAVITVVCTLTMVICYSSINIYWRRRPELNHQSGTRQNKKLLITSLLVVGTFLVCWLPYVALSCHNLLMWEGLAPRSLFANLREFIPYFYVAFVINTLCDALTYAVRVEAVRNGYGTFFGNLRKVCRRN